MRLNKKLLEHCKKIVKLTDWRRIDRELPGCSPPLTLYERFGTGPKGRFRAYVVQGGFKLPWIAVVSTTAKYGVLGLDSLYGNKTKAGAQRAITPWLLFRAGHLGERG